MKGFSNTHSKDYSNGQSRPQSSNRLNNCEMYPMKDVTKPNNQKTYANSAYVLDDKNSEDIYI